MRIGNGTAAIVSGGASGLGEASVRMLAARGARVAILDLNREAGEALAQAVGGRFFLADISDEAAVLAALDSAEATHGAARILVNCAGIGPAARTVGKNNLPHPVDLFRRTIEINLIGTFSLVAHFASRLAAEAPEGEERGVIVNTASVAAYDGQIGQAAYSASKGGIVGMTLPIARDLSSHLIRMVTIAPGIFLTPMLMTLPEEARESLGRQVPHPSRLGKPEEFAGLVEAIIANPMLNGEVIRLDGAIRMAPR